MEKYISREDVPEVLSHLYEILCEVSPTSYHVIFSMGTIVRIDSENIEPFEYTPEHMETWPVHRLGGDINPADVYKDLCDVYRDQSADKEYGDIVKCAFTKLFSAEEGVPVICDLGDVTYVQFADYANIVYSAEIDDENIAECVDSANTMFEFDCMFPQIYALITPSLEIILYVNGGV